jgi:hypothetical protein
MSQNSAGKTVEAVKCVQAMAAERIGAATVYYNGQSITTGSGIGFDSQGFDDAVCVVNIGTVLGAVATVKNAIYESDTDDPTAATALTGADFTDAVTTNDEAIQIGSVQCRDTKRYLFLKTETQGAPLTVDMSATWIGGKPDSQATDHTVVFDV